MTLIKGMLTSIPVFRSVRVNPAKSQEPFQKGGVGLKACKGWGRSCALRVAPEGTESATVNLCLSRGFQSYRS